MFGKDHKIIRQKLTNLRSFLKEMKGISEKIGTGPVAYFYNNDYHLVVPEEIVVALELYAIAIAKEFKDIKEILNKEKI